MQKSLNSYFESTGYKELTDKIFCCCLHGEKQTCSIAAHFSIYSCSQNGAGTDVMLAQDPVSHSPMARMARQTPLGRREWPKTVLLVTDTMLHKIPVP